MSDSGSSRVQVFHPNGTFDFKFGANGSADGQFYRPSYAAYSPSADRIAVADFGNGRVQVFHPNGTFDFKFGSRGSADGSSSMARLALPTPPRATA